MNKTILSTNGTPLNLQDNGSLGGYIALGMVGNKFAVFSLLNKQVQLLRPSDLKEMNLKAIFYYVYGVLHSQEYRDQYGADLKKVLPRT